MHFPLSVSSSKRLASAALVGLALAIVPQFAAAETAYIKQSQTGARLPVQILPLRNAIATAAAAPRGTVSAATRMAPETMAQAGGRNTAQTLQIGNLNSVAQIQNGANNQSAVGIIAGNANNVGVLQNGNNLRSNVVLLNTQGLSVGVLQPNGSAPVNMLIARLPNGSLLIKR